MSPWLPRSLVQTLPVPKRHSHRRHRGVACVEMAVLTPIIVMLLLGMWEIGRLSQVQQLLSNAAREGGRQASTGKLTNAEVEQVVTSYIKHAGIPTQHLSVVVQNLTSPGIDSAGATQLDRLQVTATLPFVDVRWTAAVLVTHGGSQLSATSYWRSTKDLSYPTNITAPPGY